MTDSRTLFISYRLTRDLVGLDLYRGLHTLHLNIDLLCHGQGKTEMRELMLSERESLTQGHKGDVFGSQTFDVYLNEKAHFRNIPEPVWKYALGGYKVLSKWLSYREDKVLGRSLSADEAMLFASLARRIAALLLLGPELDDSYSSVGSR